jgi:hypothetical protein
MKTNPNLTIALSVSLLVFTSMYGATRPPAMDPNTVPFVVDPNSYDPNAPLIDYMVTDANVSVVSVVYAHNKGGWETELAIVMADGSPTSSVIAKLTPKPVKDPNGGWNQGFEWSWTPPDEGIYFLELRLSTKGKPTWKGDRRTVVVFAGQDVPFLWVIDVPVLRLAEAQKFWQVAKKQNTSLTKPTRVWR